MGGGIEVRILIVPCSDGDGEGVKSIEQDINEVYWVMDNFTLHIHMYNIVNGIVGIKFSIVFVKEGYPFQSILEVLQSMVLCGGGFEEAEGGSQENEVYGCVNGWYSII